MNNLKSNKERGYEIKIVEGDDIKKYYKTEALIGDDTYSVNVAGLTVQMDSNLSSSEIMRSCMRDKEKVNTNIFDIYTKNPESCKMAVMLDKNGRLFSRAILWKASISQNGEWPFGDNLPKSFWFMDRVYSVENWMDKSMYDWATKKGYVCKRGNWGNRNTVFNGEGGRCDMEVDVKKIGYRGFPFMDTFIYYDVKNGKLRNSDTQGFKGFGLQSTTGNYSTTTGHDPVVRNYIRRFTK